MISEFINIIGKLWNKLDFPSLGTLRFNILYGAYHLFPLIRGIDYPRLAEWKFTLKHLPDQPTKIIDIGSATSLFPFKLSALGHDTHCLDQRKPNFKLPKKITFHQGNLLQLPFPSDSFDAITCISVIEHVGMGRYGDEANIASGDEIAMREMMRILKPKGRLVVTTNITSHTINYDGERRYGKDKFKQIISYGKIVDLEYKTFNGYRWVDCDEEKAFRCDTDDFNIAMFVLTK